jgi:transcriptional regulator GlxA family with amidase domain
MRLVFVSKVVQSSEPIEMIAASDGFQDPERMRRAFLPIHGQSPQAIRRMAGRVIRDSLTIAEAKMKQ